MTRGRKPQYASAADRQRAYRQRRQEGTQGSVTKSLDGIPNNVTAAVLGLPHASGGHHSADELLRSTSTATGAVCAHSEASGLLVRIVKPLDGGRVMAEVVQPGTTQLIAGQAYPFRADWLAEVAP